MNTYREHYAGEPVNIIDSAGNFIFSGIVTKVGTFHATVNESETGYNLDVVYSMINKRSTIKKTAQAEIIKEDEKEDKKFILSKTESNVDGKLSVKYEVTVDGKMMWKSEEIVTNVYDNEKGWSAPDDFDENKLDLIQQTAEAGFDMVVESYDNMRELVEQDMMPSPDEEAGATPTGKPAFAPGTGPKSKEAPSGGGGGGATMIGGEPGDTIDEAGEAGDMVGLDGEEAEVSDENAAGGVVPFAAEPEEEPLAMAASLEQPSFARSVLSAKGGGDNRLHGNPQHRLNPALREEMKRRNIDSGDTHDIDLSERLKGFDYAKSHTASLERLNDKISKLTQEK